MPKHGTTVTYTCPNCNTDTEVNVSPIIPAQLYGPLEDCYPEEGGEIEPTECPHCNQEIDHGDILDKADFSDQREYERD